jgi:hypothetical protein
MNITRRIFTTGLAAVLSVFRITGVSAREAVNIPDDDFDDAPIQYLEVGEREDMLGGPATEAGWYLHPECMIGCCKSEGPFPTKAAALEADRICWQEITKRSKSEDDTEEGPKVLEPLKLREPQSDPLTDQGI